MMRSPARVRIALASIALTLAACSGAPKKPTQATATRVQSPSTTASPRATRRSPYAPAQEDLSKRGDYTRGGLYAPNIQDSAPAGLSDVDLIPEPEVTTEPRSRYGNRSPYVVLGRSYAVLPSAEGYDETGIASYYGNKFHGRRTSNLEVYDMYAFSAAHKTLPLPSYARVTNLGNGRSVIVRVNDRGPFHDGRIIDLSYAAAVKLGVDRAGTARVEVRGLGAGENARNDYDAVAIRAIRAMPTALPAGVHIATGKPHPASSIDQLVSALPIGSANAGERVPQAVAPAAAAASPAPANTDWRFDMRQDGRTMSADEFDAWMQSRRARVATGRPGTPLPRVASPGIVASPANDAPIPARQASSATLPAAVVSPPIHFDGNPVTLQVASFAARGNAEHALAMLQGAGIGDARLLDADANGRKVWRLRVGPVAAAAATELVARLQGLGFGQPQRVRE